MVLCFIALAAFAVLGIFSAKYRAFAREAFRCVTRKAMLRPCDTALDVRIKAKVTSRLMRWPSVARFTRNHFDAISWVFTIALIASTAYSIMVFYNLATYGTCDPANPQNCVFQPAPAANETACPANESFNITESKMGVS